MKHLQIFKPGKHTATSGAVIEFTEQMLRDAVQAYDPKLHEAPLVVGHPKGDHPAYGWVQSLQFGEGGAIEAVPHQVDAEFAELVNAGRYKKLSASWYLPDAPANPKPGTLYLRHVGFLGAQPPALKGLKSASFAEGEAGVVEFGDWTDRSVVSLFRRLRDFLVDQFGMEKADQVLPGYELEFLQEQALKPTDPTPAYHEGASMTPQEIAAAQADLKAREDKLKADQASFAERETALAARETAVAAVEKTNRGKAIGAFVDDLVKQGKVLPKDKARMVAFMEALPEAAQVIEFAEGDKKTETPALKVFQDFLQGLPKAVDFGERGAPNGAEGAEIDLEDPLAIAQAAQDFQESEAKAGRHVSTAAAVQHVTTKQGATQ